MYTIQQLQAADYLLKRLHEMDALAFTEPLKIVIRYNNDFWHGDFILTQRSMAVQSELKAYGQVDKEYYSPADVGGCSLLHKVLGAYKGRTDQFTNQPLRAIDELPLLFQEIFKIVDEAQIEETDSPIRPYLMNATSLCKKIELPFLYMGKESIQVASLIEVPANS